LSLKLHYSALARKAQLKFVWNFGFFGDDPGAARQIAVFGGIGSPSNVAECLCDAYYSSWGVDGDVGSYILPAWQPFSTRFA
jgi:hypothetical protein